MAKRLILGVDFDGTCVEHCYPRVGPDIGAAPYLKALADGGVSLILWTMRSGKKRLPDLGRPGKTIPSPLMDAVAWFKERDIPLFGVNRNPEQKVWSSSPKVYCHLYLDDAAFGCPLVIPKEGRPYVDWKIAGPSLSAWAKL